MYLHPTLCITPERLPLGISDVWQWTRGTSKKEDHKKCLIKESQRWVEGYERVAEMAVRCPEQRLVYVTDREGDMLDLLKKAQKLGYPADWLIRATHNRKLSDQAKLWDAVDQHTLATKSVEPISITLVQAKEVNPPKGKKPIVWRLTTNRKVETEAQALEIIDWYRCRWEIEMFFDVLKVGCQVERLQLATKERIEKALSLYMIVTWRVMVLM